MNTASERPTRLHDKLARIRSDPQACRDFILCDAKDADMAQGATAPGLRRDGSGRCKTGADYRAQMRAILKQDDIDLMLTSVSTLERLHLEERCFDATGVATAVRFNDSTDVWQARASTYHHAASRPFASANLVRIHQLGLTRLGLYSLTFTNDAERDRDSLQAFAAFREQAMSLGLSYFLEVFNPGRSAGLSDNQVPGFVNDCIVRALAGLSRAEQPLFLKVAYNGRQALEELVAYDDRLPVGIMGGHAGTCIDTFRLLQEAQAGGARLALFGRKINLAEDPVGLLTLMRQLTQGAISPTEAVRAYHAGLQRQGLRPDRPLLDDLLPTT